MAEEVARPPSCGRGPDSHLGARLRRWALAGQPFFLAVALCAAGLAAYAWAGDGGDAARRAPVLVRTPLPALWVALTALTFALLPGPAAARERSARLWPLLGRLSPLVASLTAAAVLWCVWHSGAFVAGGSDSSGYVSQSLLWARGEIVSPVPPLAQVAPWPAAESSFISLGYRPGAQPGTMVPIYAPGLPLLMAMARLIAGPSAVFSIVPLTGLLLLASAYSLGRLVAGPVAGAVATVVVASSPTVLFAVLQPMSDLPAAALWVAASAVAARRQSASPLLIGLLASLAVLVRPNLVPVAIPLAAFVAYRAGTPRAAFRALLGLAGGLLPGVALIAAIHATLYGSPLRSGYGSLTDVFALRHLLAAIEVYPARAFLSHSAFLGLAFLAPLLLPSSEQRGHARSVSVFLLLMAAVLFLCYAFYDWWCLRFLVGSIVLLLVLAAVALIRLIERFPPSARAPLVVLTGCIVVGLLLQRAATLGVFGLKATERRYVATADWVNEHLPQHAALVSMQHSGSLRYYTGRLILRWDLLPRRKLDGALLFLSEHGHPPYVVLDCAGETKAFARRSYGRSDLSQMDWPTLAEIGGGACVRILDPAARAHQSEPAR